jgi:hypothetical protein
MPFVHLGFVEKSPKINANRNYQASRLGRDHARARALRLLAEGKAAMGVTGEEKKVAQGWIAEQLKMGSAANVSQQIRRFAQTPSVEQSPKVSHGSIVSIIVDEPVFPKSVLANS